MGEGFDFFLIACTAKEHWMTCLGIFLSSEVIIS